MIIQHYPRAEDIKACHILFVSQSETRHADEVVRSLTGKPIWTVAEADAPSTTGAVIRFSIENHKEHFRINRQAADEAQLVLSSKLLRVAEEGQPGGMP